MVRDYEGIASRPAQSVRVIRAEFSDCAPLFCTWRMVGRSPCCCAAKLHPPMAHPIPVLSLSLKWMTLPSPSWIRSNSGKGCPSMQGHAGISTGMTRRFLIGNQPGSGNGH